MFSRRSARRLVSFSSLLSSLLSFVSFAENVPFEKDDEKCLHNTELLQRSATLSHGATTKILHPPYNSGFLQQRRQPFDFFPLSEIVDVFQSGLFQFFLRLFARIVERAAENLALRLESKVLVLVCVEDVTDSRVNLNDVTSGVDDVRDPGGAVSGGDVAGDGISSAERAEDERPFWVEYPFGFKHSRSGGIVARYGAVDESELRSRAFQRREFVQAATVQLASFGFGSGFFRVVVEVLVV